MLERGGRLLEAGEDADEATVEVGGQLAQFADIKDLHLPCRDVRSVGAHAEIGIACQTGDVELQRGEPVAETAAGSVIVVQQREMRALRHEHDGLEAEGAGTLEKVVQREPCLARPDAGITDGVKAVFIGAHPNVANRNPKSETNSKFKNRKLETGLPAFGYCHFGFCICFGFRSAAQLGILDVSPYSTARKPRLAQQITSARNLVPVVRHSVAEGRLPWRPVDIFPVGVIVGPGFPRRRISAKPTTAAIG